MINLIRADLFTLRRSRGLLACFAVTAAAAALFLWFSHQIALGRIDGADGSGPGSLFADVLVVHLLGSLIVGTLIARDFETKTIHDVLLSARRGQVVAAKSVLHVLVLAALVLPYAVLAVIAFLSDWRLVPFLPTTLLQIAADTSPVTASALTRVILLALVTMVVYAGQLAVVIPLSFVVRKPAAIMGLGFVWGFASDSLARLAPEGSWIDGLLTLTPYGSVNDLTMTSGAADIVRAALASVVFIVAMAGLAWLRLRRMDVK